MPWQKLTFGWHVHVVQVKHMRVDIETLSHLSSGQTVCDFWGYSQLAPNCTVCLSADVEGVWEMIVAAIAKADGLSRMSVGH